MSVLPVDRRKGVPAGQSIGMDWEREFFGCSSDQFPEPPKMDKAEAINAVVAMQSAYNWNPDCPSSPMGQLLYQSVQEFLEPKDAKDLKLYCAIGSALDRHYSADAFFRIRSHVVPINITAFEPKRDSAKAIIVKKSEADPGKFKTVGKKIAGIFTRSILKHE